MADGECWGLIFETFTVPFGAASSAEATHGSVKSGDAANTVLELQRLNMSAV